MFSIFGKKTDAVDTGKLCDGDDVGDVLKLGIVVGFDERDALDADGKNIAQLLAETIPRHDFVVDLDFRTAVF